MSAKRDLSLFERYKDIFTALFFEPSGINSFLREPAHGCGRDLHFLSDLVALCHAVLNQTPEHVD